MRDLIAPALRGIAVAIEHVGSTSVPGLPAKPIIDIDVVVPDAAIVPAAIGALTTLGYEHEGDKGIPGREAFKAPPGLPAHHLYVIPDGAPPLLNHLRVRDYLRAHPDAARQYGELKKRLAAYYREDREGYTNAKTKSIAEILQLASEYE